MWRKTNDPKPSSQSPSTPATSQETPRPVAPAQPAPSAAQVPPELKPVVPQPPAIQPAAAPPPAPSPTFAKASAIPERSGSSKFSSGLKVRGEISGSADLYLDGELNGKITIPDGVVTVGPNGNVHADIEAREVVIEGVVQGNLKARDRVHLGSSSRVQGSVLTPRIGIEDGARLRGKVEMVRGNDSRSTAAGAKTTEAPAMVPVHASSKDS